MVIFKEYGINPLLDYVYQNLVPIYAEIRNDPDTKRFNSLERFVNKPY